MKQRLTDTRRASLEGRLLKLRAYLEPDKISNIVDGVGPDQVDIKPVLDKIIKYMEGAPESTSIKEKKANLQAALVRAAFEMGEEGASAPQMPLAKKPAPPMGAQPPMDDGMGNPQEMMGQVQDLETTIQGMDDDTLMQEIQALEERMKQDLQLGQPSPEGMGGQPPANEAPAEEAPMDDTPDSNPEEDEEMPKLAPEHKMALLMSLPEEIRAKKAASMRALADALDSRTMPVSQNNHMTGKADEKLSDPYEPQEEGSMKDAHDVRAALTRKVASLIQVAEEAEEAEKEEGDKEAKVSAAVIGLALRHLQASMQREAEHDFEDEVEQDRDGEHGSDKDKSGTDGVKGDFVDEKRAILQARLAAMRRKANVDGRSMKTPKEVPSPEGTTEDELHGDAKIQYQNALGGTHMSEIQLKRQKLPTDKQVAGNDEPNALYISNKPASPNERITSDPDSSKDVNNKRTLKDMENATQVAHPASPDQQIDHGNAGSHQKTKDWEKAKSESDKTPTGPRLVGLEELVKERTSRAMKLAGKMAAAGLIKTEAHLQDQVIKLAEMDDDVFGKIAEFHEATMAAMPRKAELPPEFLKNKNNDNFKAHEGDPDDEKPPFDHDDEDDEEENKTAARSIRRVAGRSDDTASVRRAAEKSNTSSRPSRAGLARALNVGNVDDTSVGNTGIFKKVAQLGWSDAFSDAEESASLDDIVNRRR